MQGFKKLILPLMIAALAAGCGDKKEEAATDEKAPTQVAAKVNDTEITVHQVNFALQRIPNLDKDQSKAASLQVVRSLVDQELLVQKARPTSWIVIPPWCRRWTPRASRSWPRPT